MSTMLLFPTPVYYTKFTGDQRERSLIDAEIENALAVTELSNPWHCNVKTSFRYDDNKVNVLDKMLLLRNYIREHVEKFIGNDLKFSIKESWLNVTDSKGYQDFHIHTNTISGCFYHRVPKDSGDLILRSDSTGLKLWKPYQYQDSSITPEDSSLILFPSFLEHAVRPNLSDKARISLAFNLDLN